MKEVTKFVLIQEKEKPLYGCLPKKYVHSGFDYGWNSIIIFHDTMEHWFENTHKYFKGKYAFNIAGEVAAMGSLFYLYKTFNLKNRISRFDENNILLAGANHIIKSIAHQEFYFGTELLSCISYQAPRNTFLEIDILTVYKHIKKLMIPTDIKQTDFMYSIKLKKSITLEKLRNLYRWGYNSAEKRFPRTAYNKYKIHKYLEALEELIIKNNIKNLTEHCEGFTITLTTRKEFNYKIKMHYY